MSKAREEELSLLFRDARTHFVWQDRPVSEDLLRELYDLVRMGPTAGNSHPLRVLFVSSAEGKEKLLPALAPMNLEKVRTAPVTAVLAYDEAFYERMPQLFPARPEMRETLAGLPDAVRTRLAEHSALLAGGYLILAARALGLDAGPLGGFDPTKVNEAFFAGTTWRTLLLVNLGYGEPDKLFPRNPRLAFNEACRIA